jgi:hypothetical protein
MERRYERCCADAWDEGCESFVLICADGSATRLFRRAPK